MEDFLVCATETIGEPVVVLNVAGEQELLQGNVVLLSDQPVCFVAPLISADGTYFTPVLGMSLLFFRHF